MRGSDSRTNDHKWIKLNGTQWRCKYCGCIKTLKRVNGENKVSYQDNSSMIHTEYLKCSGKPDNSEFYT